MDLRERSQMTCDRGEYLSGKQKSRIESSDTPRLMLCCDRVGTSCVCAKPGWETVIGRSRMIIATDIAAGWYYQLCRIHKYRECQQGQSSVRRREIVPTKMLPRWSTVLTGFLYILPTKGFIHTRNRRIDLPQAMKFSHSRVFRQANGEKR